MDGEQRQHLAHLRQNHIDRLRCLEIQAARRGADTPPDVLLEIKEKQAAIADIEVRLGGSLSRADSCLCHEQRFTAALAVMNVAVSAVEAMLTDIPDDPDAQALLDFIHAEQRAFKILVKRCLQPLAC